MEAAAVTPAVASAKTGIKTCVFKMLESKLRSNDTFMDNQKRTSCKEYFDLLVDLIRKENELTSTTTKFTMEWSMLQAISANLVQKILHIGDFVDEPAAALSSPSHKGGREDRFEHLSYIHASSSTKATEIFLEGLLNLLTTVVEESKSKAPCADASVLVEVPTLVRHLWLEILMKVPEPLLEDAERRERSASSGENGQNCFFVQRGTTKDAAWKLMRTLVMQDTESRETILAYLCDFVQLTPVPQVRGMRGFGLEDDWEYNPHPDNDDTTTCKKRNSTGKVGLFNRGSTCYMNAVLQQLIAIPELCSAILRCRPPPPTIEELVPTVAAEVVPIEESVPADGGEKPQAEAAAVAVVEVAMPPPAPTSWTCWCSTVMSLSEDTCEMCGERKDSEANKGNHQDGIGEEAIPMYGDDVTVSDTRLLVDDDLPQLLPVNSAGDTVDNMYASLDNLGDGGGDDGKRAAAEPERKLDKNEVIWEAQRTFRYVHEGYQGVYDAYNLVRSCRDLRMEFPPTSQNDASEFYDKIIDRIEVWMKKDSTGKYRERVSECLGGRQVKEKACNKCDLRTTTLSEPFYRLEVQVRQNGVENTSLEQCLREFVKPENLTGDNKVECTRCEKRTNTTFVNSVSKLPQDLAIHLRRFEFDMTQMQTVKLNNRVTFRKKLNMWPYTNAGILANNNLKPSTEDQKLKPSDCQYELVGVLVHRGRAGGGHYYSFVKGTRETSDVAGGDDKWHECNDERVRAFDPDDEKHGLDAQCFGGMETSGNQYSSWHSETEKTHNAFMLFYRRCSNTSPDALAADIQYLASEREKGELLSPRAAMREPGPKLSMPPLDLNANDDDDDAAATAAATTDNRSGESSSPKRAKEDGAEEAPWTDEQAEESRALVKRLDVELRAQNNALLRQNLLFDPVAISSLQEIFDAMTDNVVAAHSAAGTSAERQQPLFAVTRAAVAYFVRVVLHHGDDSKIEKWKDTIARIFLRDSTAPSACVWFLNQMKYTGAGGDAVASSESLEEPGCWLRRILTECPSYQSRNAFVYIVKRALDTALKADAVAGSLPVPPPGSSPHNTTAPFDQKAFITSCMWTLKDAVTNSDRELQQVGSLWDFCTGSCMASYLVRQDAIAWLLHCCMGPKVSPLARLEGAIPTGDSDSRELWVAVLKAQQSATPETANGSTLTKSQIRKRDNQHKALYEGTRSAGQFSDLLRSVANLLRSPSFTHPDALPTLSRAFLESDEIVEYLSCKVRPMSKGAAALMHSMCVSDESLWERLVRHVIASLRPMPNEQIDLVDAQNSQRLLCSLLLMGGQADDTPSSQESDAVDIARRINTGVQLIQQTLASCIGDSWQQCVRHGGRGGGPAADAELLFAPVHMVQLVQREQAQKELDLEQAPAEAAVSPLATWAWPSEQDMVQGVLLMQFVQKALEVTSRQFEIVASGSEEATPAVPLSGSSGAGTSETQQGFATTSSRRGDSPVVTASAARAGVTFSQDGNGGDGSSSTSGATSHHSGGLYDDYHCFSDKPLMEAVEALHAALYSADFIQEVQWMTDWLEVATHGLQQMRLPSIMDHHRLAGREIIVELRKKCGQPPASLLLTDFFELGYSY
jgi:hypothetical protein